MIRPIYRDILQVFKIQFEIKSKMTAYVCGAISGYELLKYIVAHFSLKGDSDISKFIVTDGGISTTGANYKACSVTNILVRVRPDRIALLKIV